MKIETHDSLRNPQVLTATRVLVRNQFDEPVVVITENFGGGIMVLAAGDQGFEAAVATCGAFVVAKTEPAKFPEAPRVVI